MTDARHQRTPRQTRYEVMQPDELRSIRKRLKWTQDEGARHLEISVRGYKQYELGERPIPGPVKILMREYSRKNT
jgi:DNA-binding transcriptional regulator YiaG